jgi:hypothetical protein
MSFSIAMQNDWIEIESDGIEIENDGIEIENDWRSRLHGTRPASDPRLAIAQTPGC